MQTHRKVPPPLSPQENSHARLVSTITSPTSDLTNPPPPARTKPRDPPYPRTVTHKHTRIQTPTLSEETLRPTLNLLEHVLEKLLILGRRELNLDRLDILMIVLRLGFLTRCRCRIPSDHRARVVDTDIQALNPDGLFIFVSDPERVLGTVEIESKIAIIE